MGYLVREVLWSEETEAEGALQARDRLGRVTTFGASDDQRRRRGSEAQPASWAAKVGYGWIHRGLFPGKPRPHGAIRSGTAISVAPAISTWAGCLDARDVFVAVAMANRLSALLTGNVAREREERGAH